MTTPAPVSHAPDDYVCPFCGLVAGDVSDPGNRCELGDTCLLYTSDAADDTR